MLTSWPSYAQNIFVFVFFGGRRCAATLFFVCLFFVVRVREGGGREGAKEEQKRSWGQLLCQFFVCSCHVFFLVRVPFFFRFVCVFSSKLTFCPRIKYFIVPPLLEFCLTAEANELRDTVRRFLMSPVFRLKPTCLLDPLPGHARLHRAVHNGPV